MIRYQPMTRAHKDHSKCDRGVAATPNTPVMEISAREQLEETASLSQIHTRTSEQAPLEEMVSLNPTMHRLKGEAG